MDCDDFQTIAETKHITNKQLKQQAAAPQNRDAAGTNVNALRMQQANQSRKIRDSWAVVEAHRWHDPKARECSKQLTTYLRTKNLDELFVLLGDSNVRKVAERDEQVFQDNPHKIIYYVGVGGATLDTWIEVLTVFAGNEFIMPKAWRGVGLSVGANRPDYGADYSAERWTLAHELLISMRAKFVFHLPLFCTQDEVDQAYDALTANAYRSTVLFHAYCIDATHVHLRSGERIEWITVVANSVRDRWRNSIQDRTKKLPHFKKN